MSVRGARNAIKLSNGNSRRKCKNSKKTTLGWRVGRVPSIFDSPFPPRSGKGAVRAETLLLVIGSLVLPFRQLLPIMCVGIDCFV